MDENEKSAYLYSAEAVAKRDADLDKIRGIMEHYEKDIRQKFQGYIQLIKEPPVNEEIYKLSIRITDSEELVFFTFSDECAKNSTVGSKVGITIKKQGSNFGHSGSDLEVNKLVYFQFDCDNRGNFGWKEGTSNQLMPIERVYEIKMEEFYLEIKKIRS